MKRFPARWYAGMAAIILFGTGLVVYTGIKAGPLLRGPQITVTSPAPGAVSSGGRVAVIGTAENVSYLTLSGRQIFVDERGIFNEVVLVPWGYTILEIVGSDRFGRETREYAEIVRKSE